MPTIESKYGSLELTPWGDDRVSVRAGGYSAGSVEPLTVNGVDYDVSASVYLHADGSWQLANPHSARPETYGHAHISRSGVMGRSEPTDAARKAIRDALPAAVTEWARENADALAEAGENARKSAAAERDETIAKLQKTIAALAAEAAALRAGGRVVEVEHRFTNGGSEECRHVRTAAGELLPAVPTPPDMRHMGTSRYGN